MTELVEFVFSGAGALCLSTGLLLWLRLQDRPSKLLRVAFPLAALYTLAAIYPVGHGISQLFTHGQRPFQASDVSGGRIAIAVLGSGSHVAEDWDGARISVPNETSMERVVEAARVYRLVHAEWVIASGGRVYEDDPGSASAESGRRLLIELGVPSARILTDGESKNTHEESVAMSTLLQDLHPDRVIVVTSDLHMPRALGAFRSQGIAAVPAVSRRPYNRPPWGLNVLPSDIGLAESGAVARELLGVLYYAARGWYRFS